MVPSNLIVAGQCWSYFLPEIREAVCVETLFQTCQTCAQKSSSGWQNCRIQHLPISLHPIQLWENQAVPTIYVWPFLAYFLNHQWQFQEPKLEVPTIYKAYSGLNFRKYAQKIWPKIWYVYVPPLFIGSKSSPQTSHLCQGGDGFHAAGSEQNENPWVQVSQKHRNGQNLFFWAWKTIGKWWFNGILMGFNGILMGKYPLVICYIAIENGHRNSGFSH